MTLPDDERILVRELPLRASVEKLGKPFGFVSSPTPARFALDQLFQHRIDIASPAAETRFSLLEGAEGMSIDATTGMITWQVPEFTIQEKENVVVEITPSGEAPIYSRLDLRIDAIPRSLASGEKQK